MIKNCPLAHEGSVKNGFYYCLWPRGGGGGVLQISSVGDDRRIFLGLKCLTPGFFWAQDFASIFWVA